MQGEIEENTCKSYTFANVKLPPFCCFSGVKINIESISQSLLFISSPNPYACNVWLRPFQAVSTPACILSTHQKKPIYLNPYLPCILL